MPLAESIRDELAKVFTLPQADVLASCVVRAHDTLATRSDMHELRVAMTELAVQEKKTQAQVAELAVQQRETSKELQELASTVRAQSIRTDTTAGWALEWLVGKHLPAYVGRRIKRCRIVGAMDVIESLEGDPAAAGLTADDLDELRRADLVATGTIDGGALYLVGEVSFMADNDDILRAARRAAVLRKAGQQAQAFVACDQINPIPSEIARREGVWVIHKGRLLEPAA